MSSRLTRRRVLLGLAATPVLSCVRGAGPSGAREVSRLLAPLDTVDGAGVRLNRVIGQPALPDVDPFLLLDELRSDRREDFERGFPTHPHRGFETVTVMLAGAMDHRDSVGNHGHLTAGSVQWMTAGRGIVHSELPRQPEGLLWGLQLWVNLPRRLKWTAPRYQDVAPERVPEVSVAGQKTRVLAGAAGGVTGPVEGIAVAPTLLDVTVTASRWETPLAEGHAAFVYVLEGTALLGDAGQAVTAGTVAVLGPGARVVARAAHGTARLLLAAAAPVNEPVARRGPFVMNTQAEVEQAFEDYRTGRLVSGG
jgi:redox-sensitive bicupin YhaK (pirin superfamily)